MRYLPWITRTSCSFCPRWKDSKNKVFMLSAYAGEDYRPVEIRDPYNVGIEETRRCYSVLNACIRNLIGALSSGHKNEV